jgi:Superinfection immunity protein
MRRSGLRAGAWALAGTVMITLAAGCGAAGHATSPGQGPGPQIFTMKMVTDHRRLDRGVLAYSVLAAMQARQAALLAVEVTDVGRGPETSAFTRQSRGWTVDRQNVPTGGTVSVQIICSAELACASRTSSARQAILRPGRSATWTWDITARSPGDAQILITAVSYRGDSRVVASQMSVATGVKVRSTTPLYTLEAAFDARKKAVLVSAAVLAAVVLLGGAVALDRKRARGRPASRPPAPRKDRPALRGRLWPGPLGRAWPGRPGRTWLGLRGRAWLVLLAIDVAVGALVAVLARDAAARPPAFAITAAGVAVVLLPVYFLPVLIARARRVPDLAPVVVINAFLGWTFFGWVVALALAVRDRPPGRPAASAASSEPAGYPAYAVVPRMRLEPVPPSRAEATLMVWQTPDDGLTCQEPEDDWVRRWTYGVSLGQDAEPRFVLTGQQPAGLERPAPGRLGEAEPTTQAWPR